jgi:hypothetical protein
MKTMELGVSSTFFLEQIHGGAAGVGCVWRRKFGVELFFGSGAAWSSTKHALSKPKCQATSCTTITKTNEKYYNKSQREPIN